MEVTDFSEIEAEFHQRIQGMVCCSMATVDSKLRPRSRVVHPIWEGATGWLATDRTSYKAKHLTQNSFVSLAYVADIVHPVFVDCTAEWVDDLAEKQRIWELFRTTPEPLGYDPAFAFGEPDNPHAGLLKFTPWRIDLVTFPSESFETGTRIWRRPATE